MKKLLILVGVFSLLIGIGIVVLGSVDQLHSTARRNWSKKSIAEISARVADPSWSKNEQSRLKAKSISEPGSDGGWLSDKMIAMENGDWLTYASICHKEDSHVYDLFLARGSDGRWYYSTYHFCIGMIVLKMDGQQPNTLAGFAKTYYLRPFDGQSDECLKKTWPPNSR